MAGGRWWRSWSARSQVERVDLYTRQSLYLLMWSFAGLILFGMTPAEPVHRTSIIVGGMLLTAGATVVLRDVIGLYPATGPLPWRSIGPFLAACAVALVAATLLPEELRVQPLALVWSALAWALSGLRDYRATAALLVTLGAITLLTGGPIEFVLVGVVAGCFFVFTTRCSLWLLGLVTELDRARGAQAALAVAEERLRFSRDVHDVLGRRLSTMAVQSELAATLAARGDPRAAERMLGVRAAAHDALREARELARGYRPIDLSQELDGARSLLRSAGISVDLEVDDVPAPWHEAAGWVVRETVTNVLRHSAAQQVRIVYGADELTISNDGANPARGQGGAGLAGLRERLLPLGAELSVSRNGTDFTVVASLPGPGPLQVSGSAP
jgi:two-component system sensor histidine kinase DesK